MKLYGKELQEELDKRRIHSIIRKSDRKSLREGANELGMDLLEYLDWEYGKDICPHEESHTVVVGFHPPFLLVDMCTVCNRTKTITKINNEDDIEKHKEIIEESLKDVGYVKKEVE